MRSDMRDALRRWLGPDTRALDVLSDDELAELHNALTAAKASQARALAKASAEAERHMPAMLRGSISKLLGR
jgi:hypothetical protein